MSEQKMEISEKLKQSIIDFLLSKEEEELNKPYISMGASVYTRRELAEQVRQETEHGKEVVNNLIELTIDLLNRGKIKSEKYG